MAPTTTSTIDSSLPHLTPSFKSGNSNSPAVEAIIKALNLAPHPEGGYFVETDRDPSRVPNPFKSPNAVTTFSTTPSSESETRSASTSIFYLLSPASPTGHFHTNRARTVHTLHKGRGRYVLLHPTSPAEQAAGAKAKIETFVVGQDVAKGERLQWVVEGGLWKGTFLLSDVEGEEDSREGLLISETVVPGFEFEDHDFLTRETLEGLVTGEQVRELGWMVRRDG